MFQNKKEDKENGQENTETKLYKPRSRLSNNYVYIDVNFYNKAQENNIIYNINHKKILCANCGELGHVIKECTRPITSFGIMAFKIVNNKNEEMYDKNKILKNILGDDNDNDDKYPKIKFLMIQRKDTMGYIDFLRGKYSTDNDEAKMKKINTCFSEMTFKEKSNLLTKTFDELWCDLWVNHSSKCFKNEYTQAKKKYDILNIKYLVENSKTIYEYQEFGLPKGRRNMREKNIECAEREFFEETGYKKSDYQFIKNYPIIEEEFMGTNDVKYKHIYYLVKMKEFIHPPYIDNNNKIQIGEVQNIGWFTINECLNLMRPYDNDKKRVLISVYNDILKMSGQYNVIETNLYTQEHQFKYQFKHQFNPIYKNEYHRYYIKPKTTFKNIQNLSL
jgi:8-oxo-dGTP pyrophosphatase MutT (NUDIX family)